MKIKENLNKIHFLLSDKFDVELNEKSNLKLGNYIEFIIKENNKELKAFIRNIELNKNIFNWNYFSNPLDEKSLIVERRSSVNNFINDVIDIFEKNRFDSDYIKKIK
jgi:hypothetical protein